jgi:hypothetical protein
MEMERLRAANAALESEVDELEEERLKLKRALRVKALGRGDRAAVLQMSVEKLTALEEMQAGLYDDPEMEHGEGARRLRAAMRGREDQEVDGGEAQRRVRLAEGGAARGGGVPSPVDFSALGEHALRERAGALQAALAEAESRLVEAEAGRRSAERSRVSLATDKADLEARVRLLSSAQTGGAAQAAAMRALLNEMDTGMRALSHALQAEAVSAAAAARPLSASTSRLGAQAGTVVRVGAGGQAGGQAAGQVAAAAAARGAALSARLATRIREIESAPPPPPPDPATVAAAAALAATGRLPARAPISSVAPILHPATAGAGAPKSVDAEAARSAARLRSLQGLAEPGAETVALPSEIEASDAPPEVLMAAMAAQLLEAMAALAQREQVRRGSRSAHQYRPFVTAIR